MADLNFKLLSAFIIGAAFLFSLAQCGHFLNADGTPHDMYHDLHVPRDPPLYPTYHEIPKTSFTCEGKEHGYHADTEAQCQNTLLQNGIPQMQPYNNFSYTNPDSGTFEMQIEKKGVAGKLTHSHHVASLQDLISKLYSEFDKDIVDVDYICDIMKAYKSIPHEWRKYAKFDRYRYTRNLVDSGNGKFNLMILCWGEGHGSAIHDHADAHCFMKVLDGTLNEVRFAYPDKTDNASDVDNLKLKETGRTDLKINEVCYINDSLGLHRVENRSQVNPAVSLHLYCPPFDSCSIFNQQTGQKTKCKVTFWSKYGEPKDKDAREKEPEDNWHDQSKS